MSHALRTLSVIGATSLEVGGPYFGFLFDLKAAQTASGLLWPFTRNLNFRQPFVLICLSSVWFGDLDFKAERR